MREYDYTDLFVVANETAERLCLSNDSKNHEKYIEVKMSLVQLADACKQQPQKPIWEVVQGFYDEGLKFLIERQEKQLKDTETFCVVQKLSEAETKETLEKVNNKLLEETNNFKIYQNYLIDILGLKITDDLLILPA